MSGDDSLFMVMSCLPSTACWYAVLAACVIVCVSPSVSEARQVAVIYSILQESHEPFASIKAN